MIPTNHKYIVSHNLLSGLMYNVYLASGRSYEKLIYRYKGDWNGKPVLMFQTQDNKSRQINPSYIESIDEAQMEANEHLFGAEEEFTFDTFDDETAQKGKYIEKPNQITP